MGGDKEGRIEIEQEPEPFFLSLISICPGEKNRKLTWSAVVCEGSKKEQARGVTGFPCAHLQRFN